MVHIPVLPKSRLGQRSIAEPESLSITSVLCDVVVGRVTSCSDSFVYS